jgi:hypothetical protein
MVPAVCGENNRPESFGAELRVPDLEVAFSACRLTKIIAFPRKIR